MSTDRWNDAVAYEQFMGRWSTRLGEEFVSWLQAPPGSAWLEIGCGTGSLTDAILRRAHPRHVTACDTSSDFVDFCRSRFTSSCLHLVPASIDMLPALDGGYDVVASNLVLNFLPSSADAVARMRSVCGPRGMVGASVWDYADGMEFLRIFWDAASALDTSAAQYHEGRRFPLCRPEALRSAFEGAGLESVQVGEAILKTHFLNFDDFWRPLLGGQGPAPAYLGTLSSSQRQALSDRLRAILLHPAGDFIPLTARAWFVKGRRNAV